MKYEISNPDFLKNLLTFLRPRFLGDKKDMKKPGADDSGLLRAEKREQAESDGENAYQNNYENRTFERVQQ